MKHFLSLFTAATLLTSSLSATSGYFCNSICQRCNDLCGIFGGAEALYFKAEQDDLNYSRDERTHALKYDWQIAGRGWYGYQACSWDAVFVYDWIENDAHGDVENLLTALLSDPLSGKTEALEAEAKTCLHYQSLDFLIGRSFCFFNGSVMLRPFLGGRGIRLDQKLEVKYSGEDFDLSEKVHWNSQLKVAGLQGGIDMHYFLNRCFGWYGTGAGSLLYGNSKSIQKQPGFKDSDNPYVKVTGFQAKSGLFWHFHCPCYVDGFIKLGYEYSRLFNMPRIRTDENRSSAESSGGTFTLQGVTLSAELIF